MYLATKLLGYQTSSFNKENMNYLQFFGYQFHGSKVAKLVDFFAFR